MALIIPAITDLTNATHANAFVKASVLCDLNAPAKISLFIWANFAAYKANARMLFNDNPITFTIPKTSQLYAANFNTDKVIPAGKSLVINFYDNILKLVDGSESSICFYQKDENGDLVTRETYDDEDNAIVDENGDPVLENILDVRLAALSGFDFTSATNSFSQAEFDALINGLSDPQEGDECFIEDTETYYTYTSGAWVAS